MPRHDYDDEEEDDFLAESSEESDMEVEEDDLESIFLDRKLDQIFHSQTFLQRLPKPKARVQRPIVLEQLEAKIMADRLNSMFVNERQPCQHMYLELVTELHPPAELISGAFRHVVYDLFAYSDFELNYLAANSPNPQLVLSPKLFGLWTLPFVDHVMTDPQAILAALNIEVLQSRLVRAPPASEFPSSEALLAQIFNTTLVPFSVLSSLFVVQPSFLDGTLDTIARLREHLKHLNDELNQTISAISNSLLSAAAELLPRISEKLDAVASIDGQLSTHYKRLQLVRSAVDTLDAAKAVARIRAYADDTSLLESLLFIYIHRLRITRLAAEAQGDIQAVGAHMDGQLAVADGAVSSLSSDIQKTLGGYELEFTDVAHRALLFIGALKGVLELVTRMALGEEASFVTARPSPHFEHVRAFVRSFCEDRTVELSILHLSDEHAGRAARVSTHRNQAQSCSHYATPKPSVDRACSQSSQICDLIAFRVQESMSNYLAPTLLGARVLRGLLRQMEAVCAASRHKAVAHLQQTCYPGITLSMVVATVYDNLASIRYLPSSLLYDRAEEFNYSVNLYKDLSLCFSESGDAEGGAESGAGAQTAVQASSRKLTSKAERDFLRLSFFHSLYATQADVTQRLDNLGPDARDAITAAMLEYLRSLRDGRYGFFAQAPDAINCTSPMALRFLLEFIIFLHERAYYPSVVGIANVVATVFMAPFAFRGVANDERFRLGRVAACSPLDGRPIASIDDLLTSTVDAAFAYKVNPNALACYAQTLDREDVDALIGSTITIDGGDLQSPGYGPAADDEPGDNTEGLDKLLPVANWQFILFFKWLITQFDLSREQERGVDARFRHVGLYEALVLVPDALRQEEAYAQDAAGGAPGGTAAAGGAGVASRVSGPDSYVPLSARSATTRDSFAPPGRAPEAPSDGPVFVDKDGVTSVRLSNGNAVSKGDFTRFVMIQHYNIGIRLAKCMMATPLYILFNSLKDEFNEESDLAQDIVSSLLSDLQPYLLSGAHAHAHTEASVCADADGALAMDDSSAKLRKQCLQILQRTRLRATDLSDNFIAAEVHHQVGRCVEELVANNPLIVHAYTLALLKYGVVSVDAVALTGQAPDPGDATGHGTRLLTSNDAALAESTGTRDLLAGTAKGEALETYRTREAAAAAVLHPDDLFATVSMLRNKPLALFLSCFAQGANRRQFLLLHDLLRRRDSSVKVAVGFPADTHGSSILLFDRNVHLEAAVRDYLQASLGRLASPPGAAPPGGGSARHTQALLQSLGQAPAAGDGLSDGLSADTLFQNIHGWRLLLTSVVERCDDLLLRHARPIVYSHLERMALQFLEAEVFATLSARLQAPPFNPLLFEKRVEQLSYETAATAPKAVQSAQHLRYPFVQEETLVHDTSFITGVKSYCIMVAVRATAVSTSRLDAAPAGGLGHAATFVVLDSLGRYMSHLQLPCYCRRLASPARNRTELKAARFATVADAFEDLFARHGAGFGCTQTAPVYVPRREVLDAFGLYFDAVADNPELIQRIIDEARLQEYIIASGVCAVCTLAKGFGSDVLTQSLESTLRYINMPLPPHMVQQDARPEGAAPPASAMSAVPAGPAVPAVGDARAASSDYVILPNKGADGCIDGNPLFLDNALFRRAPLVDSISTVLLTAVPADVVGSLVTRLDVMAHDPSFLEGSETMPFYDDSNAYLRTFSRMPFEILRAGLDGCSFACTRTSPYSLSLAGGQRDALRALRQTRSLHTRNAARYRRIPLSFLSDAYAVDTSAMGSFTVAPAGRGAQAQLHAHATAGPSAAPGETTMGINIRLQSTKGSPDGERDDAGRKRAGLLRAPAIRLAIWCGRFLLDPLAVFACATVGDNNVEHLMQTNMIGLLSEFAPIADLPNDSLVRTLAQAQASSVLGTLRSQFDPLAAYALTLAASRRCPDINLLFAAPHYTYLMTLLPGLSSRRLLSILNRLPPNARETRKLLSFSTLSTALASRTAADKAEVISEGCSDYLGGLQGSVAAHQTLGLRELKDRVDERARRASAAADAARALRDAGRVNIFGEPIGQDRSVRAEDAQSDVDRCCYAVRSRQMLHNVVAEVVLSELLWTALLGRPGLLQSTLFGYDDEECGRMVAQLVADLADVRPLARAVAKARDLTTIGKIHTLLLSEAPGASVPGAQTLYGAVTDNPHNTQFNASVFAPLTCVPKGFLPDLCAAGADGADAAGAAGAAGALDTPVLQLLAPVLENVARLEASVHAKSVREDSRGQAGGAFDADTDAYIAALLLYSRVVSKEKYQGTPFTELAVNAQLLPPSVLRAARDWIEYLCSILDSGYVLTPEVILKLPGSRYARFCIPEERTGKAVTASCILCINDCCGGRFARDRYETGIGISEMAPYAAYLREYPVIHLAKLSDYGDDYTSYLGDELLEESDADAADADDAGGKDAPRGKRAAAYRQHNILANMAVFASKELNLCWHEGLPATGSDVLALNVVLSYLNERCAAPEENQHSFEYNYSLFETDVEQGFLHCVGCALALGYLDCMRVSRASQPAAEDLSSMAADLAKLALARVVDLQSSCSSLYANILGRTRVPNRSLTLAPVATLLSASALVNRSPDDAAPSLPHGAQDPLRLGFFALSYLLARNDHPSVGMLDSALQSVDCRAGDGEADEFDGPGELFTARLYTALSTRFYSDLISSFMGFFVPSIETAATHPTQKVAACNAGFLALKQNFGIIRSVCDNAADRKKLVAHLAFLGRVFSSYDPALWHRLRYSAFASGQRLSALVETLLTRLDSYAADSRDIFTLSPHTTAGSIGSVRYTRPDPYLLFLSKTGESNPLVFSRYNRFNLRLVRGNDETQDFYKAELTKYEGLIAFVPAGSLEDGVEKNNTFPAYLDSLAVIGSSVQLVLCTFLQNSGDGLDGKEATRVPLSKVANTMHQNRYRLMLLGELLSNEQSSRESAVCLSVSLSNFPAPYPFDRADFTGMFRNTVFVTDIMHKLYTSLSGWGARTLGGDDDTLSGFNTGLMMGDDQPYAPGMQAFGELTGGPYGFSGPGSDVGIHGGFGGGFSGAASTEYDAFDDHVHDHDYPDEGRTLRQSEYYSLAHSVLTHGSLTALEIDSQLFAFFRRDGEDLLATITIAAGLYKYLGILSVGTKTDEHSNALRNQLENLLMKNQNDGTLQDLVVLLQGTLLSPQHLRSINGILSLLLPLETYTTRCYISLHAFVSALAFMDTERYIRHLAAERETTAVSRRQIRHEHFIDDKLYNLKNILGRRHMANRQASKESIEFCFGPHPDVEADLVLLMYMPWQDIKSNQFKAVHVYEDLTYKPVVNGVRNDMALSKRLVIKNKHLVDLMSEDTQNAGVDMEMAFGSLDEIVDNYVYPLKMLAESFFRSALFIQFIQSADSGQMDAKAKQQIGTSVSLRLYLYECTTLRLRFMYRMDPSVPIRSDFLVLTTGGVFFLRKKGREKKYLFIRCSTIHDFLQYVNKNAMEIFRL